MAASAPAPHPEPLLERDTWLNLDGPWEFAVAHRADAARALAQAGGPLPDHVVVPFCLESARSGAPPIGRRQHFVYARDVTLPADWDGASVFLRIGAADYGCDAFVNGVAVGSHEGGFTPMAFGIDAALRPGPNRITLHVWETRKGRLPRGKQTHLGFPYVIFYTPFSGIWQSVWLEARGTTHVAHAALTCPTSAAAFAATVTVGGPLGGTLRVALTHPDGSPDAVVEVPITAPTLGFSIQPERAAWWSPDTPQLYGVTYEICRDGAVIDGARGYAGLRHVHATATDVSLNGAPFYQKLVLYQAYYPEGWATPVSDDVLRDDIAAIKALGFNGLRIHQTLAHPRLLYWCDRLGLVAWAEMPSPFIFARVDRGAFARLLDEAITRDQGHPSIIAWVLFNETWGILDLWWRASTRAWIRSQVAHVRGRDPGRLVIDNSGYDHLDTDIVDIHHYLADQGRVARFYERLRVPAAFKPARWRNLYMVLPSRIAKGPFAPGGAAPNAPVVVSECGGHGFGPYGGQGLTQAESLAQTVAEIAAHPHLRGFAYTQFCDVAQETNGLVTFDRVPKVPPADVRAILERAPAAVDGHGAA